MLPKCFTELHCVPCAHPYTSPLAKTGLSNFQSSNAFHHLLLEVNTSPYLLVDVCDCSSDPLTFSQKKQGFKVIKVLPGLYWDVLTHALG